MNEIRRAGGQRVEEVAVARPREQVVHAHASECPGLLAHQYVERARLFIDAAGIDETYFAVLAETLALGTVAPARGRRALGPIELVPGAGELGQMRAARIEPDFA